MKKMLLLTALILSAVIQAQAGGLPGFKKSLCSDEQELCFSLQHGVRVYINAPSAADFDSSRKVYLILFALPNGNTIEWTRGKKMNAEDDWHFDIQHIDAQTRFLRRQIKDANIVTAYLETEMKSWPAWRRKYPDNAVMISRIVDSLRSVFRGYDTRVFLNGHSGGGSFIFGFINSADTIPGFVQRIGFLDSDYAYDDALQHGSKLALWLKSSPEKYLCVIAYNDSSALLNGNRIVSDTGGTWYRSKLMKRRLELSFPFITENTPGFLSFSALSGRVRFILKENPKQEIFHTRQVELNGFIHSILTGTPLESKDYTYFGERAYKEYIQ